MQRSQPEDPAAVRPALWPLVCCRPPTRQTVVDPSEFRQATAAYLVSSLAEGWYRLVMTGQRGSLDSVWHTRLPIVCGIPRCCWMSPMVRFRVRSTARPIHKAGFYSRLKVICRNSKWDFAPAVLQERQSTLVAKRPQLMRVGSANLWAVWWKKSSRRWTARHCVRLSMFCFLPISRVWWVVCYRDAWVKTPRHSLSP